MTRYDDPTRLRHMLDRAAEAVAMTRDRTRQDLDTDRQLSLALTRLLEIVGEAATRVSPGTRRRYSQIPWDEVIGLRNRLVHAYDKVDFDILWDIIQYDLPPLITHLHRILDEGPLE